MPPPQNLHSGEEKFFSDDYRDDFGRRLILCLLLANILLIWISGMLMFRMKSSSIKKKIFWKTSL
jgi:hypothetical protein